MKKALFTLVVAATMAFTAFGASAVEAKSGFVAEQAAVPAMCVAERDAHASYVAAPLGADLEAAKAKLEAGDLVGAVMVLLFGSGGLTLAMTTLSVDRSRSYELGDYNDLPVIASDIIYEGAAVGDNGTNAHRPLVAADRFVGFAETTVDNSLGAAGAKNVRVRVKGRVQLPITSFDVTDVGKPVFASDDDTFTLTQSTNSHVGKAVRFVATGSVIVEFDAHRAGAGAITELTDSSGGTANDTIAAVGTAYDQATLANNFADIAAKVNALLRQAKG